MSTKNDRAVQAAIRKKIGEAGIVDAMLATLRGEQLPLRSAITGEVTGLGDSPSIELRMAVADKLLARISPQLRAVDIETAGGGDDALRRGGTVLPPWNAPGGGAGGGADGTARGVRGGNVR